MSLTNANSIYCVKGEIHNVLTVMRLHGDMVSNARFFRELPDSAENPMFKGLRCLHDLLSEHSSSVSSIGSSGLEGVDAVTYVQPFLDIIVSEKASALVTLAALSSLHKFLQYGLLGCESPGAGEAVNRIASFVVECEFEAVDTSMMEVMLMKIIAILLDCLRCPAGILLEDDVVTKMVVLCYEFSQKTMLSELLQKMAETTLMQIILFIFGRLPEMESSLLDHGGCNVVPSISASSTAAPTFGYGTACMHAILKFLAGLTNPSLPENNAQVRSLGLYLINVALETGGPSVGSFAELVPVIQDDICKFLLQNSQSDDLYILSLALRVVFNLFMGVKAHLKVQLEVFFNSIHLRIAKKTVSNSDSFSFEQQELALESIVEFCREPALMVDLYVNYDCAVKSTNLFENLAQFLCEKSSSFHAGPSLTILHFHAMEGLLALLFSLESFGKDCKRRAGVTKPTRTPTFPNQSEYSDEQGNNIIRSLSPDQLRSRKKEKKRFMLAAELFNRNPKKAIPQLQAMGLLPSPLDSAGVVSFLRATPSLDKAVVGDYISDPDPFNREVLKLFVSLFDFSGCAVDEALRNFLESFRLPGEAQKIDRIMESFAERLYSHSPGPLANADAGYVLSFSIIMLNTDLHNPNITKRMTLEEFIRNNRGINNGNDLPREYLENIYTCIKDKEIKLNDNVLEADESGESKAWKNLLDQSRAEGEGSAFVHVGEEDLDESSEHVRDMFLLLWLPSIRSLTIVFESTHSKRVMEKVVSGFQSIAAIGAVHRVPDAINVLIKTLCQLAESFMAGPSGDAGGSVGDRLSGDVTASSITVDTVSTVPVNETLSSQKSRVWLSISREEARKRAGAFGLSLKSQTAVRAVFSLCHRYGSLLRDSWKHVFDLVVHFHALGVLPQELRGFEDFVGVDGKALAASVSRTEILTMVEQFSLEQSNRLNDLNKSTPSSKWIFSAVSSYLWGGDGDSSNCGMSNSDFDWPETGHLNKDHPLAKAITVAETCVSECNISSVFRLANRLSPESLTHFVLSVVSSSLEAVRTLSASSYRSCSKTPNDFLPPTDALPSTEVSSVGPLPFPVQLRIAFCMEVLTNLCLAAKPRLPIVWHRIMEHFENVLKAAGRRRSLVAERLVVNVLRMCVMLVDASDEFENPILSDTDNADYVFLYKSADGDFTSASTLPSIDVLSSLDLILSLAPEVFASLAERISSGLYMLLRANASFIRSPKRWHIIFLLLRNTVSHLTASSIAFDCLTFLISPEKGLPQNIAAVSTLPNVGAVFSGGGTDELTLSRRMPPPALSCYISLENYLPCLDAVVTFLDHRSSDCDRQVRTLDLMLKLCHHSLVIGGDGDVHLSSRSPVRSQSSSAKTSPRGSIDHSSFISSSYSATEDTSAVFHPPCGRDLWIKTLLAFCRALRDPRREIHGRALVCLQEALLVEGLSILSSRDWQACFERVFFPVLASMFVLNSSDPTSITNTQSESLLDTLRLRFFSIVCKTFLKHLNDLIELNDFQVIWVKLLGFVERFCGLRIGNSAVLVMEQVKNVLLVMIATGVFTAVDSPYGNGRSLWELTLTVLDAPLTVVCPGLKDEIVSIAASVAQSHNNELSQSLEMRVSELSVQSTLKELTSELPVVASEIKSSATENIVENSSREVLVAVNPSRELAKTSPPTRSSLLKPPPVLPSNRVIAGIVSPVSRHRPLQPPPVLSSPARLLAHPPVKSSQRPKEDGLSN